MMSLGERSTRKETSEQGKQGPEALDQRDGWETKHKTRELLVMTRSKG